MATFLALYRGETIGGARLLTVTTDPGIIADVAARLLEEPPSTQNHDDPALQCIADGKRRALLHVLREVEDE